MKTRQIVNEVIESKRKGLPSKNPQGEKLYEDLGLDSLDVMEIIMECEIKLGVKIPDAMCVGLQTKEDIFRLFDDKEEDYAGTVR